MKFPILGFGALLIAMPLAHAQVYSDQESLYERPSDTSCADLSTTAGDLAFTVRCNWAEGGAVAGKLSVKQKACLNDQIDVLGKSMGQADHKALLAELKLKRIIVEFVDNSHAKKSDKDLQYGTYLGSADVRELFADPKKETYRFESYSMPKPGDAQQSADWRAITGTMTDFGYCFRKFDETGFPSWGHSEAWDKCQRNADRNNYLVPTPIGHQRRETVLTVRLVRNSDRECPGVTTSDLSDSFAAARTRQDRMKVIEATDVTQKVGGILKSLAPSPASPSVEASARDPRTLAPVPAVAATIVAGPLAAGQRGIH